MNQTWELASRASKLEGEVASHSRKLEAIEKGPWDEETDYERKQRVVREKLGYNPDATVQTKRTLEPPSASDVAEVMADLKTKPAPPSEYLKRALRRQG